MDIVSAQCLERNSEYMKKFFIDVITVWLCILCGLVVSKTLDFSSEVTIIVVIMYCIFGGTLMGILDYYKCNKNKKE